MPWCDGRDALAFLNSPVLLCAQAREVIFVHDQLELQREGHQRSAVPRWYEEPPAAPAAGQGFGGSAAAAAAAGSGGSGGGGTGSLFLLSDSGASAR